MSLEDLIPVVNKLQDIVTTTQLTELDLPILAVVGSQSCGKSSVLENIVGKDFLPRGTGVVTRRPLVLQLINIKPDDPVIDEINSSNSDYATAGSEASLEDYLKKQSNPKREVEWGEFLHIPNTRLYSFKSIRDEIEKETSRLAGNNKGISRIPINLKIYSTRVLNLTLVDLPGLTKIPVGDQPTDIERQTRSLILEYISKPNTIILAVSPANVDLVNSESLKLARQVDPVGKRTLGILSKLDLMDQGTNALDVLKGNVYPLKLGFIGVVNRSQQDISDNKSLEESLYDEEQYFKYHSAYRQMSNRCGTRYLTQTLNKILMSHIRERLPDIKAKLNTLMGQTEQELAKYGEFPSISNTKEQRGALVLNLMTKFASCFTNSIEGTAMDEVSTKELAGGARIYYIFNEMFGSQLAAIDPTQNLTVHDIRTAIRNSTGPRPSLFVPELAFDLLVKPQIRLLENPSHRCVEQVYEELMKILHNVCSLGIGLELNRYPRLQSKLIEVVSDLLRERLGPTSKYVASLIEIHTAYINTNHPNFVGAGKAMTLVVQERQKQRELEHSDESKLNALKSNKGDQKGEPDGNLSEESGEKDEIDDINQVDDEIKPAKYKKLEAQKNLQRHTAEQLAALTNSSVPVQISSHESYLNYFFGKDPITQRQHMQAQAQLNPTPFKFPQHQDSLQFNNVVQNGYMNGINGSRRTSTSTPHFKTSLVNNLLADMSSLSISDKGGEGDDLFFLLTEREQLECELIRRLIVSYFGIVREMIQDQVPKLIMCLLVNFIKQNIQNRLVVKLYNENIFEELLQEDEDIQLERERCVDLLKTYREASRIISDVV